MMIFSVRLMLTLFFLCTLSLRTFAGQLDDHYLTAFGAQPAAVNGSALQRTILFAATESATSPHCGTPLRHGLRRDWHSLEPDTQSILAKQLVAPVLIGEATFDSAAGHFKIHYATSGADIPPVADLSGVIGVPDWVEVVAATFEQVRSSYISRGYTPAPTVAGAPYDVYLLDMSSQGVYGQTTSSQPALSAGFANAYTSFMEIDNDFTDGIYTNAAGGPYSATQSLQITAAHEYQHSIHYGYNIFFDIWYAEATSTWYEDELYDNVNQLYSYIPAWFRNSTQALDTPTSTATGGGYGRWIFNRYLSERHGAGVIRAAWEKLATLDSPGGNADIPMLPVLESLLLSNPYNSTLGADFFGFAKRVYVRDWGNSAVSHPQDLSLIHPYLPVATVSSFPASSSSTLPHYSFAFFKFTPSATVPVLNLNLSKTSGIQAALFKTAGSSPPLEIAANNDGSYTVAGFGSLSPVSDEVVLLAANITDTDNQQISFGTNGTAPPITEPGATTGAGGGGCFIATAAYGSYLHPQVQILREFRDHSLLTNAPGRSMVALYYQMSPPLADFIAQHGLLRSMTRVALIPVIAAVLHPVSAVTALLLGIAALCLPLRRHFKTDAATD